jgi:hypothetical protein
MCDDNINNMQLRSNKSKNFVEDDLRCSQYNWRNRSFLSNFTDTNECRSEVSDGFRYDLDNDADYFNQKKVGK